MAMPIASALAGALTLGSYFDAKYHIRHDVQALYASLNAGNAAQYVAGRAKQDRMLMYHILEEQVAKPAIASNMFLIFPHDGRNWTYDQFFADVNRIGNWLLSELGVQKDEIVALDGLNSPEYLISWFAIESIGACPSFLNHNLTSNPLEHCLKLCGARYCLADEAIKHLVAPVEQNVEGCKVVYYSPQLFSSLAYPATPPPQERRAKISPSALRCLLYTSGTTGLPKAVMKRTGSELSTGHSIANYLRLKPSDRYYSCLPLFHGAAHSLFVTPSIHAGSSLVLGRKFSNSTFWPEVVSSGAVIMQYVGELCRYLLNSERHPLERKHKLRMAWGNGMRPDVWEPFRERFNIPIINELYASTDGMGTSFNDNKGEFSRHAIGVRGLIWKLRKGSKEKIVKIDADTQEIVRDPKSGFATVCCPGESGETVHWVDPETPDASFAGYYKNNEATNKRYVRDLFRKGDMWFRSGDTMRHDASGCIYFVDRLGDTYRWKSENISTNEVADLLGTFPGIDECNVYGVLVPKADGRAGCAALVLSNGVKEEDFDFKGLTGHLMKLMPRYAVPIFLRITPAISYTGTMKMQKGKLRQEGCSVEKVEAAGDRLYWLPPGENSYRLFTHEQYAKLSSGDYKL